MLHTVLLNTGTVRQQWKAHQATGARWFLKIDIKDFFDIAR